MQERAEILAKLEGLENLFNEKFENNAEEHSVILDQVKKINGRVSGLENLKNKIIGGLVVSNIIVVPVLLFLIDKWFGE